MLHIQNNSPPKLKFSQPVPHKGCISPAQSNRKERPTTCSLQESMLFMEAGKKFDHFPAAKQEAKQPASYLLRVLLAVHEP